MERKQEEQARKSYKVMLDAYSVRMTSCGLGSEKAAILEEVLLIKFSLKYSLSIFAITHFQKSRYGCCPVGIFKSPDMVDILLAQKSR